MNDATPYTIPKEPGRWRALTLAVLVHLALLALLWIGVRWQNETPVAVEAEIWSPQAQQAAPKPQPQPQPEPEPPPPPPPRVVEAPKPQPAPPPIERPVEKPVPNPDIALEQEKKKRLKEEKERRAEEERERDQQKKQAQQKHDQAEARKKELAKAEADKERRQEAERERRLEEQADKKREAEEEKKRELAEAEKKRKLADAEKKRVQAKAEAEAAEHRRIEDLSRMTAQATGSGGSGQAAKSQGPSRGDAGYAAKVGGKIRSNTVFNVPDELANNPAVEYAVDLLPDGSVRSMRKIKGSGVPGFDEAVKRAIEKSQPFPPDNSGRAPSGFTVSHKPKDQ